MYRESSDRSREWLVTEVNRIVNHTPVFDIHTHLYDPAFGSLLLCGIDDLLTYHYLVAEVFRFSKIPYKTFWKLKKTEQAEFIWRHLFISRSPLSEACRGVLTTLNQLGLDVRKKDLHHIRKWYAEQDVASLLERCLSLSKVDRLCMTNSPFDAKERSIWEAGFDRDPRFLAALRIDPILLDWQRTACRIADDGFSVNADLSPKSLSGLRHFLDHWTKIVDARYLMISLPPTFQYPDLSNVTALLDEVIIPHCIEKGLPLALMIGVKRGVNPQLRLAGDGVGKADLSSLEHLCERHSEAKFLCTTLSKEDQHELCVLARKFPNLHIFGCWWFLNIPFAVEEITRLRLELIGTSTTPQHSDARVLDQLIYKWSHFREVISKVLIDKYLDLTLAGWDVKEDEIRNDVQELFGKSFERFCNS